MEEYQQIFHKNKRYASDFYQASSNVECSLSPLYIYLSNLFSRNGSRVCWCFTMSSHLSFHFFPPPPISLQSGHRRVYKRSITMPQTCVRFYFAFSLQKFSIFRSKNIISALSSFHAQQWNSLINTILILY